MDQSPHPAFAAAPLSTGGVLDSLRRTIQALEKPWIGEEGAVLPLGIPSLDTVLSGGLASGMLHEVAAEEADIAAATGFVLALAAGNRSIPRPTPSRLSDPPVIWIAEDMAFIESGAPYGPGLDEFGLIPERLITVNVAKSRDVVWAMEEALRCRAVGAVIGEVRGQARLDLVMTRRLSLAAAQGRGVGFLLRAGTALGPSAVATRWIVAAARANRTTHGLGPPAVLLHLTRNRRGRLGSWMLEWNRAEQCFESPAHREPLVQPALDRPYRAAVA